MQSNKNWFNRDDNVFDEKKDRRSEFEEKVLKEQREARKSFLEDDDFETLSESPVKRRPPVVDIPDIPENETKRFPRPKKEPIVRLSDSSGGSNDEAEAEKIYEIMNPRTAEKEKKEKIQKEKDEVFDGILKAKTGRRRSAAVLGGLIMLFAVIGLGTAVWFSANSLVAYLKNDSRLHKYDDIITPVAYLDVSPFETWQGAQMDELVMICTWETLSGAGQDAYSMDDEGRIVIPTGDIVNTAKRIFGSDVILDFSTVVNEEDEYAFARYDEEAAELRILNTGIEGFDVKVRKLERSKGVITATVDYYDPYADSDTDEAVVSKTMLYIIQKDGKTDEYIVSAVRETGEQQ